LIVEDNAADVFLIRAALKAAKIDMDLHVVKDGEDAIRFIDQVDADRQSLPADLVLLDINLPRKQGGEVLEHIRKSHRSANARVIAVSTSDSAKDRADMSRLGADGYFHKPSRYEDFMKLSGLITQILGK